MVYILGIESSCDETAASVVTETKKILSNVKKSYIEEAAAYGGVVPEITARAHLSYMGPVLASSLEQAGLELSQIDAIAATCGPGLIGGVLVGAMTGKSLAFALNKPFIAVNHLEAHLLTARLMRDVPFPFLTLLVSGGHCQLILAHALGSYEVLGQTRDDALGEAFDKVGKMMDISYPAGPVLEEMAKTGDPIRFDFPKPMLHRPGYDFSFSGLKTAVRREIASLPPLTPQDKSDIAASFQRTVTDVLVQRLGRALDHKGDIKRFVLSGGVAANGYIRQALETVCAKREVAFAAPPVALCTDNGAMVAWAGMERLQAGLVDGLEFSPRPRWPLADLCAS